MLKIIRKKALQLIRTWLYVFFLAVPSLVFAQQEFEGQWFSVEPEWKHGQQVVNKIDKPTTTGGHFVFQSVFSTDTSAPLVIDFKNASVIGWFLHTITDRSGEIVFQTEGGIESAIKNSFFMRHGRDLRLPPGDYTLTTQLKSTYFIAQPHPYIDTLEHYRQAIKFGNLLGLVSIGIMMSLGIYYLIFALVRRRQTEAMYAFFIWMNLIFTGTSMLVTPDLLNIHWLQIAGIPLLFSNIAYVFFAKSLLQIGPSTHRKINLYAQLSTLLLILLLVVGLFNKHLALECARIGVGIMMLFALVAAIVRAREGYTIAYYYLVAIVTFFVIGSIAISSQDLDGIYTIYVEHIGLSAVTAEVLLIGLVLAYQFSQIYHEKEQHLAMAEHNLNIAHHDALTGLANRYAFDVNIQNMKEGVLFIMDMDNLKLYNDEFGHQKGDEALRLFSTILSEKLGEHVLLHRFGGDEFAAITSDSNEIPRIQTCIDETIMAMHQAGFGKIGVSFGSAYKDEAESIELLLAIADQRMYEHKRSK